jgi:hypothetical protein
MDKEKPVYAVNYGIASSYDGFIEMNGALYSDINAKLKQSVLDHERRHRNGKYSKTDFMNDFQSKNSYFLESLKFCAKHPASWIGFFPLMYSYYGKDWSWNWSGFFPFVWFGLIFSGFFKLLFGIGFFRAFLGYSVLFTFLQIILLILTHILVKRDGIIEYKKMN